jgi:hypothetical protein
MADETSRIKLREKKSEMKELNEKLKLLWRSL